MEEKEKLKCTINTLFSWYVGEDCKITWQIFNSATYDSKHCQEELNNGEALFKELEKDKDIEIEISIDEDPYLPYLKEITFKYKNKIFDLGASVDEAESNKEIKELIKKTVYKSIWEFRA